MYIFSSVQNSREYCYNGKMEFRRCPPWPWDAGGAPVGCEGVLGGGPITFNKTKAVLAPPAVNILPAPHTSEMPPWVGWGGGSLHCLQYKER